MIEGFLWAVFIECQYLLLGVGVVSRTHLTRQLSQVSLSPTESRPEMRPVWLGDDRQVADWVSELLSGKWARYRAGGIARDNG